MVTLRENSLGRMRTKESGVFGGSTAFPWALTLTLGWGRVEVPPDSLSPVVTWVFPREFKKIKKINADFFFLHRFQLRFITQVMNPNVTSGNVCPTLRVWGVPSFFSLARFWNERQVLLPVF